MSPRVIRESDKYIALLSTRVIPTLGPGHIRIELRGIGGSDENIRFGIDLKKNWALKYLERPHIGNLK